MSIGAVAAAGAISPSCQTEVNMACSFDVAAHYSRRTLLRVASLSLLGLATRPGASAARASATSGKALILLYMTGGPAQQETFDPKPDAPEGTRGEFKPTATSAPGIQ